MNKACSKFSNVEFEDVGVGNGKGMWAREGRQSEKASCPHLVFSSSPLLCNLKGEEQSP